MEGLLILVGVYVLDYIVKKIAAGKKEQEQPPEVPRHSQTCEPDQIPKPSNLEDLIKQFEEAQRESSQGTFTPPPPPIEDMDDSNFGDEEDNDDIDLPVVTPANPNHFTFQEIAESVIQWLDVSVENLQQAFGFSEETAQRVLSDLQAHHIVARDMGDGYCDLLIHDKTELTNLFKREQREAEEQQAAKARESALRARREAEQQHQKELAALEEQAKQLREQTQQIQPQSEADKTHKRTFDRAEIRRGFVWAKVLDEPRFKKKWSSQVR